MGKQDHGKSSHAPPGVLSLAALCLVGILGSATAFGGTIVDISGLVVNPTFSATSTTVCPTSWTCTGSPLPGFTGYTVTSAQYTAGSDGLASGIAPGGATTAGSSPTPVEGSGSASQTGLGTYVAGTTYQIELWIGTPNTIPFCNTNPAPGCVANSTAAGSLTGGGGSIIAYFLAGAGQATNTGSSVSLSSPALGQWTEVTLDYTASASDAGKTIGFEIFDSTGAGGNNEIANFEIGTATPEPTSLILLGTGLLFIGAAKFRKGTARS